MEIIIKQMANHILITDIGRIVKKTSFFKWTEMLRFWAQEACLPDEGFF
jgi:hypothetical protein